MESLMTESRTNGSAADALNVAAPDQTQVLIQYLEQLQRHGQTHINLDDPARLILREFYKRAKRQQQAPQQAPSRHATPPREAQPYQGQPKQPTQSVPTQNAEYKQPAPLEASPPSSPQSLQPQEPTRPTKLIPLQPTDTNHPAKSRLDSLNEQIQTWSQSGSIASLKNTCVLGAGNPQADLVFLGEAPGYHEEKASTPFCGPAGQKLDAILKTMGLAREQVYLSYLVKQRPSQPQQTTNTRKPTPAEASLYLPALEEEMNIVRPRAIIALGVNVASALTSQQGTLQELRASPHTWKGIPLTITYPLLHFLHKEATSEKRLFWEDMLQIMELLKLPISEKQRGYFLKQK